MSTGLFRVPAISTLALPPSILAPLPLPNGGSCLPSHSQAFALWCPLRWPRPGKRPRSQLAFPTMFSFSRAHVLQTSEVSALRVSTELWSPHRASDPSTEALPAPKFLSHHPFLCPPEGPDLWGRSLQPHLMVEEQRGASGRAPTCWGQGRAHVGSWDLPMDGGKEREESQAWGRHRIFWEPPRSKAT